jgi:hypothetical protein
MKIYKSRSERQVVTRSVAFAEKTWTYKCPVHGHFKRAWDKPESVCPNCADRIQFCKKINN